MPWVDVISEDYWTASVGAGAPTWDGAQWVGGYSGEFLGAHWYAVGLTANQSAFSALVPQQIRISFRATGAEFPVLTPAFSDLTANTETLYAADEGYWVYDEIASAEVTLPAFALALSGSFAQAGGSIAIQSIEALVADIPDCFWERHRLTREVECSG